MNIDTSIDVLKANRPCRICHEQNCDKDCEELQAIYREQQREKLRDIDPYEVDPCEHCLRYECICGIDPHDGY